MLGIYATAASTAVELVRDPFCMSEWAVDGDYVRGLAVVSEGQVVGVQEVGGAEQGVLLRQDVADATACFRAGVVWAEDAASVAGGEPANSSTKSAIKYGGVVFPCRCLCILGGGAVPGVSE